MVDGNAPRTRLFPRSEQQKRFAAQKRQKAQAAAWFRYLTGRKQPESATGTPAGKSGSCPEGNSLRMV